MRRVVVVGNGMVGSRFVEELVRRDPDVAVTVLGAEEYEPYNRVLLGEVVAGTVELASLTLPGPPAGGVRVRAGAVERNAVVMQESEIQEGVEVENVILDKAVTIRSGKLIGQRAYPIVIGKNMTL